MPTRPLASSDHGIVVDVFGCRWLVTERRPTRFGWPLLVGRRQAYHRGQAEVIPTDDLRRLLTQGLLRAGDLPMAPSTIARVRRTLGLPPAGTQRSIWWAERASDLAKLTLTEFAAKHGVSIAQASLRRRGRTTTRATHGDRRPRRPTHWWKHPDVRRLILSKATLATIAHRFSISQHQAAVYRRLLRADRDRRRRARMKGYLREWKRTHRPAPQAARQFDATLPPCGVVVFSDDGALVQCHACGRWLRSLNTHVRVHDHDIASYKETYDLARTLSLWPPRLQAKQRAAALARGQGDTGRKTLATLPASEGRAVGITNRLSVRIEASTQRQGIYTHGGQSARPRDRGAV